MWEGEGVEAAPMLHCAPHWPSLPAEDVASLQHWDWPSQVRARAVCVACFDAQSNSLGTRGKQVHADRLHDAT
jgi:hypothetical protein